MEMQYDRPSRTDYYLMRIAQRVQQTWSKEVISLDSQRIRFDVKKPMTKEQRIAQSKAIWIGGVKAAMQKKGKKPGRS